MNKAIDVARQVLFAAKQKGIPITNMKLQKLMYYVQGVTIGVFDRNAFNDEIQAWQYGPVVPRVYEEYKGFVADDIVVDVNENQISDEQVIDVVDVVVERLGKVDTWRLVEETHQQSPWLKNYISGTRNTITNSDMRDFFAKDRQ